MHRSHALMRKLKVTPPAFKPASLFDTTIHAIAARLSRAPEPLEFAEVLASCARSGQTCRAFVLRASDASPGTHVSDAAGRTRTDRQTVVSEKRVSVRVDAMGRRFITQNNSSTLNATYFKLF